MDIWETSGLRVWGSYGCYLNKVMTPNFTEAANGVKLMAPDVSP